MTYDVDGFAALRGISSSTVAAKVRSLDALKVIAGMAAAAGLVFHLVGSVWYEVYLRNWGLDAALFPKSADRLIIAGYETVLTVSLKLWPMALKNFVYIAAGALGLSLYWHLLTMVGEKMDASDEMPKWLSRWPRPLKSITARFLFVLSWLVLILTVLWFVGLLLAGPVALAEISARTHAEEEIVQFGAGCQSAGRAKCFELKRGTEVMRGLLIDSSPESLAFYDVALRRARVVSRAGTEMLGGGPPVAAATKAP